MVPFWLLLVWGCYAVVVRCFNPNKLHIVSKNVLTNCVLPCFIYKAGIPYGTTQQLKKRDDMCRTLVFEVGTDLVSLEYQTVMISTNWLPFVIFGNGPSVPMSMDRSGPRAGNSFQCLVCILVARLHTHSRHRSQLCIRTVFGHLRPSFLAIFDCLLVAFCGVSA